MAVLKAIQKGTITISAGNTSNTATITSVDTGKTYVTYTMASDTASTASDATACLVLTNSTTLTASRVGTNGTITIVYNVVEFLSGVNVQRGTLDDSAWSGVPTNSVNVTLSTIDTTKSWPILSIARAGGTNYNGNGSPAAVITSSTQLQIKRNSTASSTGLFVAWQVVEYQDCSVVSGNFTWSTTTIENASISAVTINKCALFVTVFRDDTTSTQFLPDTALTAELTSTTNVRFRRGANSALGVVYWYLVEFTDATETRVVGDSFSVAGTQRNIAISPTVDPSLSTVTLFMGGPCVMRTTNTGPSTQIESFMLRENGFTSSQLTLRREVTNNLAGYGLAQIIQHSNIATTEIVSANTIAIADVARNNTINNANISSWNTVTNA